MLPCRRVHDLLHGDAADRTGAKHQLERQPVRRIGGIGVFFRKIVAADQRERLGSRCLCQHPGIAARQRTGRPPVKLKPQPVVGFGHRAADHLGVALLVLVPVIEIVDRLAVLVADPLKGGAGCPGFQPDAGKIAPVRKGGQHRQNTAGQLDVAFHRHVLVGQLRRQRIHHPRRPRRGAIREGDGVVLRVIHRVPLCLFRVAYMLPHGVGPGRESSADTHGYHRHQQCQYYG